jgi:ribonuclease P protein component
MLAKNRRIGKEFFSVRFPDSRRFVSTHLLLTVVKNENKNESEKQPSRFAFSVSKKVSKRAVDRNRLRRQGYSIVGKYLSEIPSGFLFFFSFKKSAYPVSSTDLEKEICGLLSIKDRTV